MTNRELLLLLTTVVFLSTTIGLAFKVSCNSSRDYGHMGGKEFAGHGKWDKGGKRGGPDRMMKEADTNKDGQLTKDEMMSSHTTRMDKMFTELDANKDGKLSTEELAKGKKKMREKMMKSFKDDERAGSSEAPPPEGAAKQHP